MRHGAQLVNQLTDHASQITDQTRSEITDHSRLT
jgi:hypothetical protein